MPKPANYKTIEGIREKIDRQDICEIRDRAINSLYLKCKAKLIAPDELIYSKNKQIVGCILSWINERKNKTTSQNLREAITVLKIIAVSTKKGQKLLTKYGSKDFFLEFRKNANEDLYEDIDSLLKSLVNEAGTDNNENDPHAMNTHYSQSDLCSESASEYEYRFVKTNKEQEFTDSINDRAIGTIYGQSFKETQLRSNSVYTFGDTKQDTPTTKIRNYEPKPTPKEEEKRLSVNECLKDKKNIQRSLIKLEKEHCELPYVSLIESDENFIMDAGVKLRYGDAKSFNEIARDLQSHSFKDYPLETFLQRTEILNATLDIMVSTIDISVFNNCILLLTRFAECSNALYKYLRNPYNRFCDGSRVERVKGSEHIENTYPCNYIDRWCELKFNPDNLNSTNFDSHSLAYTLCEVITKTLDC